MPEDVLVEPKYVDQGPMPVLDPRIADVPYASTNPELTEPQTNVTHLPPEQGPQIEQGGPAEPKILPGTPTLDEIKEYNRLNGIVNPILDLNAGEIANLATSDPDHFNLEQSLIELKPHWNSELINKAADAYNLLEQRGGRLPSDLGIKKLPGMAAEAGVGLAKYAVKVAKSFGVPFAVAMEEIDKLMGLPPSPEAISHRQKLTQEASEALAATEASVTGLAFQGSKAYDKLFGKKPELKTQQEKIESLKAALIPHLAQSEIVKGGGLVAPSPEVQKESPIRPAEVEKTIAGDPVGFVLFGKGLEGVSGALGIAKQTAKLTAKIPGVAAVIEKATPLVESITKKIPTAEAVGGTLIDATGAAVRRGAELAEKAAPAVPFAAAVASGNIFHSLGAAAAGAILGKGVKQSVIEGLRLVQKAGARLEEAGAQVAGKKAVEGAVTQGVKDVFQAIPSVTGAVAHGAALDLGLAAITSTTPEDQQGLQLGTILGLAQGARHLGSWVVSGQRITPRAWGSKGAVQSSGSFPTLDAMHNAAYSGETPAVREHINAVRQFLKGIGADADVFLADRNKTRTGDDGRVVNTDIEKALTDAGYDAKFAEDAAKQAGMFIGELPDKNGNPRRAIILSDSDAAPHEAKHAFQDVIGEQANQVIDKVIRESYSDQWEELGQGYAEKLLGRKLGVNESWRDIILEFTGEGDTWARNSLDMKAANDFAAKNGAFPKPGEIGEAPPIQKGGWRDILSADEAGAVADRFLSREIAADTFEAIFKNLGASLKEKTGIVPWLAKIVASTTEMLGGDSLAGRRGELGTPLKADIVEAIKNQVRGRQGEVTPEVTPRTPTTPIIQPGIPKATPGAAPGTPEQEAEITKQVAAEAPDTKGPEVNAQSQREILGTMAEAKAGNYGVKITRRSAPGTPAGAIEVSRGRRREQIETARGIPDDQKPLWEKNFTPVKTVKLNDGSIQEQGWSPEVLAANAEKVAKFLSVADPALSPFEIDKTKGTFTPEGWKQLFDAVNVFAGNQAAGLTGKGTPLAIGKARAFGFFEPTGNRVPVGTLTDAEMNFINYLFGYPLPGEGKPAVTRGGSKQYGVQLISEATEPGRALPLVEPRTFASKEAERLGFAGKQVLEVNPLRAEIEATAKATGNTAPSLIEAWQNLNLRDIVRADVAPELPAVRPVGVTLRAGFKPSDNPRAVKEAAVRDEKGKIYTGSWHGEAIEKAEAAGAKPIDEDGAFIGDQGFVDNQNKWLTRQEAFDRAEELKQLPKKSLMLADGRLEAIQFQRNRQFKPSERKEIEITGPDGKKYRATFDGYQDFSVTGKGLQPQITALEDIPGVTTAKSTTYGPTLEKAGFTLPELPKPDLTQGEVTFKPSPNADVQDVAKKYAEENDIPYQTPGKPINVNEDLAKRLADFYESAKHDPSNPEVKASYDALADETVKQFNAITDAGYKIEAWKGDGEPYASSDDMVSDVRDNKHLWFKRTDESFTPAEGEENLMLRPSGINDWSINDVFRAVHDFFGHAKEGYQFGPKGELNAWKAHSQMYSDEAQGALASETLTQNSWVNYGKHLRGETGAVPKKGETGYKELTDRPFAEQKNIVVPKELIDEAKGVSFKPKDELKFAKTGSNVFEGSKAWILPNGKVEQLGGEWHHAFLDRNKDLQKKYGLKIPPFEGGDAEGVREQALRKGFARVNLAGASLVVEARQKDWKHIRPIVEDMIDRNLDDIDRFRVSLLDDKADRVVNTYSDKIFDADSDKEKMSRVYDAFSEAPKKEIGPVQFSPMPKNPRAIKQAAVRDEKTGEVHTGMLHPQILSDLLQKAVAEGKYSEDKFNMNDFSDGFVTNEGEFLGREAAAQRAFQLKQIKELPDYLGMESRDFEATRKFKPKQIEPPTQAEFDDPETIKDALAKPGWAILTGTREKIDGKEVPFDHPENLKANEELKADMDAQGLEYFPVDGTYKGKPQGESFVVLGIGPYEAQTLAKKYGQESVSVPRGLLYGDGTIVPGDVADTIVGPQAKKQEFFSTTPEGVSFSIPYEFDKPYKPVGEQEQLFGGREYVSPARLTQEELRQRYPEAIVPKNSKEKIDSDIVGSPLYKKSADPVKAFSDKLVEFAKSFESNPVYQLGLKWYSDFVPVLKEKFGKYAPMMAELLAASSPNETPTQNFYYAVDALEGFKSGRFDKIVEKYNQGFELMKDDKWLSWYNKELKAGNIPDPPATPTPEAFLGHWIFKHGLKPKQSNGQLYGFHGKAILEVMARRWLENNKGPKVANFVQNLLGIGHGATVDVWLDRTMRRLGYADSTPRWRILPKNGTGVSDADFAFAQKAMESAAKELGILPDALQGGLWFAEKSLWADNGWGRLDLGNYITEAEKLPIIQKAIKQRLRTTELKKKAVPMEQTGLQFKPMETYGEMLQRVENSGRHAALNPWYKNQDLTPEQQKEFMDEEIRHERQNKNEKSRP